MAELSESSSIPSLQPPIDLQSSNSIDDQLNSLSLQPPNDAENDGGDCDVVELEERESEGNGDEEEEERENEVESVNKSEKVNGKEEREKKRRTRFPVRVGVEDCSFYLRTGMCKFGMNCKFNHPPGRKFQGSKVKGKEESVDVTEQKMKEKDGSLDKEGQTDCKYFDRPGGCKFGKSCKFNHNRKISPALELNFMGLPIRPGEKECPYYMRTGSCKYGANCRFNHPDPTSVGGPDMLPVYSNGSSNLSSNAPKSTLAPWSPPASLNESPPYVALMFPPTQGVPSRPEWTAYQAPAYPTETNVNMPAAYAMNGQLLDINVYASQQEQILSDEFPERPGQPECSYFLKTGNCKYRYACKFHHPKTTTAKSPPACTLSDLGLPLRPGDIVCGYYNRYGICKYGPECKYDHPVHCAHSAPMAASATDENPSSGDLGVSHGAGAAGAELEAKI